MSTIEITRQILDRPISLRCTILDEGLHILIMGGDRSHIGAVSICEYHQGETKLSEILREEHRDDFISRKIAQNLSAVFHCTVTVCCGIHYNRIDPAGIVQVLLCADDMEEELTRRLA